MRSHDSLPWQPLSNCTQYLLLVQKELQMYSRGPTAQHRRLSGAGSAHSTLTVLASKVASRVRRTAPEPFCLHSGLDGEARSFLV